MQETTSYSCVNVMTTGSPSSFLLMIALQKESGLHNIREEKGETRKESKRQKGERRKQKEKIREGDATTYNNIQYCCFYTSADSMNIKEELRQMYG